MSDSEGPPVITNDRPLPVIPVIMLDATEEDTQARTNVREENRSSPGSQNTLYSDGLLLDESFFDHGKALNDLWEQSVAYGLHIFVYTKGKTKRAPVEAEVLAAADLPFDLFRIKGVTSDRRLYQRQKKVQFSAALQELVEDIAHGIRVKNNMVSNVTPFEQEKEDKRLVVTWLKKIVSGLKEHESLKGVPTKNGKKEVADCLKRLARHLHPSKSGAASCIFIILEIIMILVRYYGGNVEVSGSATCKLFLEMGYAEPHSLKSLRDPTDQAVRIGHLGSVKTGGEVAFKRNVKVCGDLELEKQRKMAGKISAYTPEMKQEDIASEKAAFGEESTPARKKAKKETKQEAKQHSRDNVGEILTQSFKHAIDMLGKSTSVRAASDTQLRTVRSRIDRHTDSLHKMSATLITLLSAEASSPSLSALIEKTKCEMETTRRKIRKWEAYEAKLSNVEISEEDDDDDDDDDDDEEE